MKQVIVDNAPLFLTDLIGRNEDTERLADLLSAHHRLITLTGPGGVGKTRLALAAAGAFSARHDTPASLVELAPVAEDGRIAGAIATALHLQETGIESVLDTIVAALRALPHVLVIDNCEHLDGVANVVRQLLARCPSLVVLATSRFPLEIAGELLFPVAPLPVPQDPEDATDAELLLSPAVTLFSSRARLTVPDLSLSPRQMRDVAKICRRLDGLPLAIELAAARTNILSPQDLLTRLADRLDLLVWQSPPAVRQRSLLSTMEWSYGLLDAAEQMLFRRLAVFAGSFTLDAAIAVCGYDADDSEGILHCMDSLVRKSLVQRSRGASGDIRFSLLETLRQYAARCLTDTSEADAMHRVFTAWCADLAERAESHYFSFEEAAWLQRISLEQENLHAALAWAISHGETELAFRLGGALADYWYLRSELNTGLLWLRRVAALTAPPSAAQAKALVGAALLAQVQRRFDVAAPWATQALAIAREHWNPAGVAECLAILGNVAHNQRAFADALLLHEEALRLARSAGAQDWVGAELHNVGVAHLGLGDLDTAMACFQQSVSAAQSIGDDWCAGYSLRLIGDVAVVRAMPDEARMAYTESLTIGSNRQDQWAIADSISGLAAVASLNGENTLAARWLGAAEARYQRLHIGLPPPDRPNYHLLQERLERLLPPAVLEAEKIAGRALTLDEIQAALPNMGSGNTVQSDQPETVSHLPELTPREHQILRGIAEGKTNREIAATLFISPRTVSWHVENILAKLGVESRTAAAIRAMRRPPIG